jgi:hypothetical protein
LVGFGGDDVRRRDEKQEGEGRALKIAIVIFILAVVALGSWQVSHTQEPPKSPDEVKEDIPKCQHKDEDEFYASLEHSPPMMLLMIDGKTATLSRTTKFEIKYLHLTINLKYFRAPKDVYRIDKNKRYLALYCRLHKHVYVLEEVTPKK